MISCRLSTILGAKRLKVSDVCRATGIARATLDRYYNDRVKSFDRDVLGKLCQFLQVKPGNLTQTEAGRIEELEDRTVTTPEWGVVGGSRDERRHLVL